MNFFQKNRLIIWILILLIVINISALTSFFILTKQPAPAPCCTPEEQQCMTFRDELSLSAEQTLKVNDINKKYTESAEPIAAAIKENRAAILTELEKDVPDTTQLNILTDQLTLLQVKIQRENIKQFGDLKRVCTPEQVQRLSALYRDLYGCPMKNGQMQNRHRSGKGNSVKTRCE
jgi:Spy/CpxP family protein refolding chaperone